MSRQELGALVLFLAHSFQYSLTTEITFSMPSESWSNQLLQPSAAANSSRTELFSVLYTRAPKDCLRRVTISESFSKI